MEEIKQLFSRVTPQIKDIFEIKPIESDNGFDCCEYYDENGKIILCGNNKVMIAHAYYNYIRKYCGAYFTHTGSNCLDIKDAPAPEHFRKTVKQKKRVYLDYITHSNSTWLWTWEDWEKELDFMAMSGINMALNVVGNDALMFYALVNSGLSQRSAAFFISGPAFYAWQITGKLDMYLPRNDFSTYDDQIILAKKIYTRMLELDIEPILSTYGGQCTEKIFKVFNKPKYYKCDQWNAFPQVRKFDILDDGFKKIFKEYLFVQEEKIGKAKYYMCDYLCNFQNRTSRQGIMKKRAAEYERLLNFCVDTDKPCIVFPSEGYNKYFLEGITKCDKLVLDIDGTMFEKTNHFNNFDCIIGNTHNNSPHQSLRGDLIELSKNNYAILSNSYENIVGVGFFPESLEQNPVYHELMFDIMSENAEIDLKAWLKDYTKRRYGEESEKINKAYEILLETCYSEENSKTDIGSTVCTRPTLDIKHTSPFDKIEVSYDNKKLFKSLKLLLESENSSYNMKYTLVMVFRQVIDNFAYKIYKNIINAYYERNEDEYKANGKVFLEVFDDLDEVLSSFDKTNAYEVFMKLKENVRDDQEEAMTTLNYLASHTIWGPMILDNRRYDYNWICLSDFLLEYYGERWVNFFDYISNNFNRKGNLEKKSPMQFYDRDQFAFNQFYESMAKYEKKIILEYTPAQSKSSDAREVVKSFIEKYEVLINE